MDETELRWLDPAMNQAIPIIRQVFRQLAPAGFAVEFAAGKEWFQHGMWSLHHSGSAVDIRTRTPPDRGVGALSANIAAVLQDTLNVRLGKGMYRVLRNDQGLAKPHLHIQYNKGGRWSEPGDFGTGSSRLA